MASFSSRQWLAVAGGAILLAALFFVNRKSPAEKAAKPPMAKDSAARQFNFESLVNQSEKQLTGAPQQKIASAEKALKGASSTVQANIYDSIIKMYDSLGMQLQSNYYREKLAALQNSPLIWTQAGEGYYDFAALMNPNARAVVLKRALDCFNHAVGIDSNYLNAKVGVGQCIVESGENPMQGITMIQGVLHRDSNNFKAQLALGEFAIQSGQYDKAIERFKKILKLSPDYIKAYLFLAQAYESSGDKKTAVVYLKKYSTFATDTSLKRQIDDYIAKYNEDNKKK